MANTVITEKTFTLADDTELTVRPLVLTKLRKFMDKLAKFNDLKDDDSYVEILVEAFEVVLEAYAPELLKKEGTGKNAVKKYEELVTLPIINEAIEVAGGVKVDEDSPNLRALPGRT